MALRPTFAKSAAQRRAENALIRQALKVLEERMEYDRPILSAPSAVRDFLRLRMAQLEHEVFIALWLDAQNRLIEFDELSTGTLTQTSIYPREVIKRALACNAGAVIFAHNHPSGTVEPSTADELLTRDLKQALSLIDVTVLDHFIVGGAKLPLSFAERGLL